MCASSFSGLADYQPTNTEPGQYGLRDFPRQRVFQQVAFPPCAFPTLRKYLLPEIFV
jgi:hypothetical protein